MADPFHLIYRHLKERRETLSDHIGGGAPRSYEEYRQSVGALQEVHRLEQEVKDIEQRLIADD